MEDKLKTAVEKIKLLSMKNEEFRNAMKKVFGEKTRKGTIVHVVEQTDEGKTSEDGASQRREKIDTIYEYCIEEVLKSQAEDFYKDFPEELQPIVNQLTADYIRMESFRHRDNFGDFCLALFQQIEGITNKLCETRVLNYIAEKMCGYPPFVMMENNAGKWYTDIRKRDDDKETPNNTIARFLFNSIDEDRANKAIDNATNGNLQSLAAMEKVRVVIYFVGYQTKMKKSDRKNYFEITKLLSNIYICRNTNHRGSVQSSYNEETITRIMSMRSFYYFKFMGVLAQFIDYVRNGMSGLSDVIAYARTLEKKAIPPFVLKNKRHISQ